MFIGGCPTGCQFTAIWLNTSDGAPAGSGRTNSWLVIGGSCVGRPSSAFSDRTTATDTTFAPCTRTSDRAVPLPKATSDPLSTSIGAAVGESSPHDERPATASAIPAIKDMPAARRTDVRTRECETGDCGEKRDI